MTITSSLSAMEYSVSFPEASKHYARITITVEAKKGEKVVAKMPVWTPGSYKVREFSQYVDETWYQVNDGEHLSPERIDKNTWSCVATSKGKLSFTYNVYAFDFGVRTSYVDQYKAFLHGPSAFMYIEGKEDQDFIIRFKPLENWENVEMALPKDDWSGAAFHCENYDLLADSPVALGNFDIGEYGSGGIRHRIVMIGKGNYDLEKVTADFKKITDEETKMFNNEHPCERYIHFIQNVDAGGGGLEHLNCQTSQVNRWVYTDEGKYRNFLGLIAHEYFHLWNVKRIRPVELGPFDYNTENYTEMLWVAEGITSYYDDLFLRRAGIHSEESYLSAVAGNINRLENQPGKDVMTLAESSKLAWVKAYLSNENSVNKTISYYNKGMLIAWMLDLEILSTTNGKKRLDDVMRQLMTEFYGQKKRGFTHDEFVKVCSEVCGKDLKPFFDEYIFTTNKLPYENYLSQIGLQLSDKAEEKSDIGAKVSVTDGKAAITYIHPDGPAAKAGLSVNDEIIAFDDWRIQGDGSEDVSRFSIGTEVEVLYSRRGKLYRTNLTIEKDPSVNYRIEKSEAQSKEHSNLYKIWIN